jgi:crotonobetainyl-CoA:carnitine CoA-transferase CaiB-like acyl-CoA transferase
MIEERLFDFTMTRDRDELFRDLQQAGVTAGPVLSAADAIDDEHLQQSGVWQDLPATEDYPASPFPAPSLQFSRSNVAIRKVPAAFGVDNNYLYKELLGLDDEVIAKLKSDGHITDVFSKEILGDS